MSNKLARAACLVLLAGMTQSVVYSASQTWTNAPVDANWANTNNWVNRAVPGAINQSGNSVNNDTATFNSPIPPSGIGDAANPIMTDNATSINRARTIGTIAFDTVNCGAYVISNLSPVELGSNGVLYVSHNGAIRINAAVTNSQRILVPLFSRLPSSTEGVYNFINDATDPNATLFINSATNNSANSRGTRWQLSGSNTGTNTLAAVSYGTTGEGTSAQPPNGLRKEGTGTWILNGVNQFRSYSAISIRDGLLIMQNPSAFAGATTATVTNQGILQIDNLTPDQTYLTLHNGGTIRMNGTGSAHGVAIGNFPGQTVNLRTTSASDVFTVGTGMTSTSIVSGGQNDSVLNLEGPGTILLGNTEMGFGLGNTFVGSWSINSGTVKLTEYNALGAASQNVAIKAGATLDITGLSAVTYTFPPASLSASGTGTAAGSTAATLVADPAATIDLYTGAENINLTFTPTSFAGDTAHPALYVAQGTLMLGNNTFTIDNASGTPLGLGTYRIVQQASGNIMDNGGYGALVLGSGIVADAAPVITVSGGNVNLQIVSATPQNLVWAGDGAGNQWDIGSSQTWLKGSTPSVFNYFDHAMFNSVGLANPMVNLVGTILPTSVTVDTAGSTYTFGGYGKIGGSTGLTKNGAGTLTLQTAHTYLGATTVNNGTVQLSTPNALPTSGTVAIESAGTLDLNGNNQTLVSLTGSGKVDSASGAPTLTVSSGDFSGTIQGTLGLTKVGTGQLTLGGSSTYSGPTALSAGTVLMGSANALGSGNSALSIDGGVLDLGGNNLSLPTLAGGSGSITNSGATGINTITVANGNGNIVSMAIQDNANGAKTQLELLGNTELRLSSGANTFSGGALVASGAILAVGSGGSLGSGTITLSNNAVLYLHNSGGTAANSGNPVFVPEENSVFTFQSGQLGNAYNGVVTAPASATNLIVSAISLGANNVQQYESYPGRVIVQSGAELRWGAGSTVNNGGDATTFEINGTMHTRGSGTIRLGALLGTGYINNPVNAAGTGNYIIGGKGVNTVFSGEFSGTNNLVKSGAGTLTLDGRRYYTNTVVLPDSSSIDFTLFDGSVSYIGTTTVSNGTLKVMGPNALTNSSSITLAGESAVLDVSDVGYASQETTLDINGASQATNTVVITTGTLEILAGQTLGGTGSILGKLAAAAGSTVNPGTGVGTLSVSGAATLAGTVNIELNRTNTTSADRIAAASANVNGATINVTNLGPDLVTGDVFYLFSGATTGTPTVNLPAQNQAGTITYLWENRLAIDGTLKVLSGASPIDPTPTDITMALNGDQLTLGWPATHKGWELQTNSVSLLDPAAWFTYPGSTGTNEVTITIDPAKSNVYYRMRLAQ